VTVVINHLGTEKRNEKTLNIDLLTIKEALEIMHEEDMNVYKAIESALPAIEQLIEQTIIAYKNGGRIIYIGAGTSGRLGMMDAVEVVPTFHSEQFIGLIAGGEKAFVRAVEGAEDNPELCKNDLINIGFNKNDFLIGMAASGRTPYVIGGLDYAKSIGAKTGCICCNINTEIGRHCDYPIELTAGPEVITGSTRLKSGTCQKIICNMISTITMVGVGKVYGNLMVDVMSTNEKLVERCRKIVMEATGCQYEEADEALKQTNNNCKVAIIMIMLHISKQEAEEKLKLADGYVRKAIN